MEYKPEQNQIQGWMAEDELQWLFQRACEMESVVEIGSWMGRSTHALLSGCKWTVWAVEHFQGNPSQRSGAHGLAMERDICIDFLINVGHFPNLKLLKMDSLEAAKQFQPKSVDLIFIDGDHDYPAPKNDTLAWLPICKKLFCGHDLGESGVRRSLEEAGIKFKEGPNTIWSYEIP